PWATPLDEVAMALMAGNAAVIKPSELTPLTGLKIKDVFARAGLADGLLQVVTGDGSTGAALVGAGVDKIMFTGSVATGKRVGEETKRLRQGDPTTKNSDIGAMTSEHQLRIVERHVYEATARGAVALTGGERVPNAPGPFFEPTVLTNVNQDMDVMREETFGP